MRRYWSGGNIGDVGEKSVAALYCRTRVSFAKSIIRSLSVSSSKESFNAEFGRHDLNRKFPFICFTTCLGLQPKKTHCYITALFLRLTPLK